MWHLLLIFLGIRDDFDFVPPGLGPEVSHPFIKADSLNCCRHCGGGSKHVVHQPPYNLRRSAEVIKMEQERAAELMRDSQDASRVAKVMDYMRRETQEASGTAAAAPPAQV